MRSAFSALVALGSAFLWGLVGGAIGMPSIVISIGALVIFAAVFGAFNGSANEPPRKTASMFDTLKAMWRGFWTEFRYSYRAHKEGGQAAERALQRERELGEKFDKALDELAEEQDAERLARQMAGAKTPEERQAAIDEITRHILKAGK